MKSKEVRCWFWGICMAVMTVGITACGVSAESEEQGIAGQRLEEEEAEISGTECIGEEETEDDGIITLTVNEFMSYEQKDVEITMDNWEEYFEICDVRVDETDVFGELTGEYDENRILRMKDGMYCDQWDADVTVQCTVSYNEYEKWYDAATLELTNEYQWGESEKVKEVDTSWSFPYVNLFTYRKYFVDPKSTGSEDAHNEDYNEITNFEVTNVSGTIEAVYYIPDEVWNVNEEGVRFIRVQKNENEYVEYYENTDVISYYGDDEPFISESGDLGFFMIELEG